MKFLKNINEYYNTSEFYSHTDDHGSIEGVIHYDENKIRNRFEKMGVSYDEYKESLSLPIAFLTNMNVEEGHRNRGLGTMFYSDFENFCKLHGAENIVLEADLGEEQLEGFDLGEWYERLGFKKVGRTAENLIMIKHLI